jgi:hypothetical protein
MVLIEKFTKATMYKTNDFRFITAAIPLNTGSQALFRLERGRGSCLSIIGTKMTVKVPTRLPRLGYLGRVEGVGIHS